MVATRNFYWMKYRCSNCYRGFMVQIPRKQEALQHLECPVCGIGEVEKTEKDIEWVGIHVLENGRLIRKVENG